MDFRKLRYFAAVAEQGSFTNAAQLLNVAQSALSRQVKLLEEELSLKLFRRQGRSVTLTDAGEALLNHAQHLQRETAFILGDMQARRSTPKGHVRVGIQTSLSPVLVPPLLRRLRAELPLVSVGVVEALSNQLTHVLQRRELDVALLVTMQDPPRSLHQTPVIAEDIAVIEATHVRDPLASYTRDTLCRTEMILSKSFASFIGDRIGLATKSFNSPMTVDSMQAIHKIVVAGEGITIAPVSVFWEELRAGKVMAHAIADAPVYRHLALAHSNLDQTSLASRAVERLLQDIVQDLALLGVFTLPPPADYTSRRKA